MRNNEERLGLNNKIQSNDDALPIATSNQSNELNFVTPTEFVELPSQGKFYSSDHPLFGKKDIEIKFMTSKEEDILTSKSLLKKGIAIDRMLQSLLLNKSINLDEIFVCDKNALIIAARISGFGSLYTTKLMCPSCENFIENTFNLDELKVFYGNLDILENDGLLHIELPKSKVNVCCKLMMGKDEKYLSQLMENKKKLKLNDSLMTDHMKMYVVSVNGNTEKGVISQFVDSMLSIDSRFLRKTYQESIPNIDMTQTITCPECEAESEVTMPLGTTFFWPK